MPPIPCYENVPALLKSYKGIVLDAVNRAEAEHPRMLSAVKEAENE